MIQLFRREIVQAYLAWQIRETADAVFDAVRHGLRALIVNTFEVLGQSALRALKIYLVAMFIGAGALGTVATVNTATDPKAANPWGNSTRIFNDLGAGIDDLLTELRGLRADVRGAVDAIPE